MNILEYRAAVADKLGAIAGTDLPACTVRADMAYGFRGKGGLDRTVNLGLSRQREGDWADGDAHFEGYELVAEVFARFKDIETLADAEAFVVAVVEGMQPVVDAIEGFGGAVAWDVAYWSEEIEGSRYAAASIAWRATEG